MFFQSSVAVLKDNDMNSWKAVPPWNGTGTEREALSSPRLEGENERTDRRRPGVRPGCRQQALALGRKPVFQGAERRKLLSHSTGE